MPEALAIENAARRIAMAAHAGQTDQAGRPYLEHVERVANAVRDVGHLAVATALLHDVLEDAPDLAPLLAWFPIEVQLAVRLLTRCKEVPEQLYYARIRGNRLALEVKLADIADNRNEERLRDLPPTTAARLRRKYDRALEELQR